MLPIRTPRPSLILAASLAVVLAGCGGGSGGGGSTPLPSVPEITNQPDSVVTTLGASATFTVAARGQGTLAYQWYKDGVGIPGATNASYTIASVANASLGAYKVLVESDNGNRATSATAYLTLTTNVAPTITSQPEDKAVAAGRPATFSVVAIGPQPFTYQWRKDGANIAGATSASYKIASAGAATVGDYSVVVTNAFGSVTSDAAALTLVTLPVITTQPVGAEVNEGTAVTFSVAATGDGLTYQWYRNGVGLARATSATYAIDAAGAQSAGTYTVKVTNEAGTTTSSGAILTVHLLPVITTQPQPVHVGGGGTATFTVAATGEGALTYQWYKDGVAVAGATGTTLTLTNVQAKPAVGSPPQSPPYLIEVRVTNAIGSRTSSVVKLTVN